MTHCDASLSKKTLLDKGLLAFWCVLCVVTCIIDARAKAASLGQLSAAVRAIEAKAKISGLLTQKPEIPIEEATPGIEEWARRSGRAPTNETRTMLDCPRIMAWIG